MGLRGPGKLSAADRGRPARKERGATADHPQLPKTGSYFPALRVASQRDGDFSTPFTRVQSLGRERVVVKERSLAGAWGSLYRLGDFVEANTSRTSQDYGSKLHGFTIPFIVSHNMFMRTCISPSGCQSTSSGSPARTAVRITGWRAGGRWGVSPSHRQVVKATSCSPIHPIPGRSPGRSLPSGFSGRT